MGAKGYEPALAQRYSDQRRRCAWKWTKRLPSLVNAVSDRLREAEQVSGFMAPFTGIGVSHQWVYSLIWDDKARGGDLWRHLRQPKRRSRHRAHAKSAGLGKVPKRVGIEHRPSAIEKRLTIGHWEGDTVLYGHKQTGIVTLVERRSGYLLAARLPSEFAVHEAVAKAVSASVYFCDPYCSGQRGTNENTNDLIRQYFPKGTDFRKVTNAELRSVVNKLIDRPRKRLGYRTPA